MCWNFSALNLAADMGLSSWFGPAHGFLALKGSWLLGLRGRDGEKGWLGTWACGGGNCRPHRAPGSRRSCGTVGIWIRPAGARLPLYRSFSFPSLFSTQMKGFSQWVFPNFLFLPVVFGRFNPSFPRLDLAFGDWEGSGVGPELHKPEVRPHVPRAVWFGHCISVFLLVGATAGNWISGTATFESCLAPIIQSLHHLSLWVFITFYILDSKLIILTCSVMIEVILDWVIA